MRLSIKFTLHLHFGCIILLKNALFKLLVTVLVEYLNKAANVFAITYFNISC